MAYAIMRFEKRKSGAVGGLARHHERQKEKYESNPDIDQKRTARNYHIIQPQTKYRDEISRRISEAECKVRKDSVLFIDTLITASPDFFEQRSLDDQQKYFECAADFLSQEVGRENIISAVVHMDERTPHLHLCFTPVTPDKRLCAKEIIGNRDKLVWWQDKFHEHMSAAFPELERGEPAIETKRKHMPVRIYKQAVRLDKEMAFIKNELESISPLNAQKKKKDISQRLAAWIPAVNKFEAQLQPFKNHLEVARHNERVLHEKYDSASIGLNHSEFERRQLADQLWEYEEFVKSIPDDLREDLLQRFRDEQDLEAEMRLEWE
jgi:hypothetical protein